jgi:hypothetical protein
MTLTFLEAERRMPLLRLPLRTTVVPVEGGNVLLSPASTLSSSAFAKLDHVTDIVAPSLLHTEGLRPASAAHPNARLWGPPGVREKRPELRIHGILGVDAWPHEAELAVLPLDGLPRFHEHLFFHPASRTLVFTDLVFHLRDARGLGARILLGIFGTQRRFSMPRLIPRAVKDRAAFQRSLSRVAQLDFTRVVPAHGAIVDGDGKAKLIAAMHERGFAV